MAGFSAYALYFYVPRTSLKDGFRYLHVAGSLGHSAAMGVSVGLVNCIDSLGAVERVVFDEKKATIEELVTALDNNFQGMKNFKKLFFRRLNMEPIMNM